jgi:hypothetical protein
MKYTVKVLEFSVEIFKMLRRDIETLREAFGCDLHEHAKETQSIMSSDR